MISNPVTVTLKFKKTFELPDEQVQLPSLPNVGDAIIAKPGIYTVKRVLYDIQRKPCRVLLELE